MSYKKKYKSIYGAKGLVNAPNHLAECIIKKRADKKGIKIPDRIWSKEFKRDLQYKYWHNAYFGELVHANALLDKYDESCIIEALHSYECNVILSLKNDKLARVARELHHKKKRAEQIREVNELHVVSPTTLPRKKSGTKTKLCKLK